MFRCVAPSAQVRGSKCSGFDRAVLEAEKHVNNDYGLLSSTRGSSGVVRAFRIWCNSLRLARYSGLAARQFFWNRLYS